MFLKTIPTEKILYLMLYGGTAMASVIVCLYLFLRKGNAFAADITSPVRLRHWAGAFYAVSFLEHLWWFLFYIIYSGNVHSLIYVAVCTLDCVTMMTTISGTLLAMLQDRKRHFWPLIAAMIPNPILLTLDIVYPDNHFLILAIAYVVLFYLLFTVFMVFAVREYRRWLRDNYADLEHKEVWQSYMLIIAFSVFVIFYGFADNLTISFLVQLIGLAFYCLLLWRVETLQQLDGTADQEQDTTETEEPEEATPTAISSGIGQLLERHCEDAQLYLLHDLSLSQLSQSIGTNHYYLSQYFTQQGLTYNAYINGLRIRHFMNLYHEAVASQRSFTAQQLAHESGFRSYSTFSAAFKQRMGQTVRAWMRDPVQNAE